MQTGIISKHGVHGISGKGLGNLHSVVGKTHCSVGGRTRCSVGGRIQCWYVRSGIMSKDGVHTGRYGTGLGRAGSEHFLAIGCWEEITVNLKLAAAPHA